MRVLVAYEPITRLPGMAALGDLVPEVELDTTPYSVPHEEQVSRERDPALPRTEQLTDAQREAFARAEVLLTLQTPLDLPAVAPRLRWVQAVGSGVGHMAPSRLADGGITLTNAAGVGAPPIAEWVVARILEDAKRFPEHAVLQRSHQWQITLGRSIAGTTVVIVGLGAIGRAVAVRLRPFGTRLVGVRRSATPGATDPDVDELVGPDRLDEVIAGADVVVLCLPGTPDTDGLFDAARFARMRPGSMLVNVGRGTLVDEPALIEALRSGHLRAAAIDVTRVEPLPPDDPLWDAPNLRLSPHSSVDGEGYTARVLDLFVRNLQRYLRGEPLLNRVDPPRPFPT